MMQSNQSPVEYSKSPTRNTRRVPGRAKLTPARPRFLTTSGSRRSARSSRRRASAYRCTRATDQAMKGPHACFAGAQPELRISAVTSIGRCNTCVDQLRSPPDSDALFDPYQHFNFHRHKDRLRGSNRSGAGIWFTKLNRIQIP